MENDDENEKVNKLELEEGINIVQLKVNKKNCKRAIIIALVVLSGQH
jgi:hypothetical protein